MVTTPNPSWPLMATQVAFNAGLNTTGTPTWTDLTPRMWSLACDRGRQYELDQVQAGVGGIVFADSDELLNPANTTSPYYPNVLPYRQILVQAQWPPAPVGGAVNLLNTGTVPVSVDPTFETYGTGGRPGWVNPVGNANPTVQAANPWQGFQSLQWTTAAGSTQQGIALNVACIPGRQYTASAYVRQTAGCIQAIQVDAAPVVSDNFGRAVSGGWGTADSGQAWVVESGAASQFSVSAGTGTHAVNATATRFRTRLTSPPLVDVDLTFVGYIPTAPTGDYIRTEALGRYIDANNYYYMWIHRFPSGEVDVGINRVSGGVDTNLVIQGNILTNIPGFSIWMRFQVVGTALRGRVWRDDQTQPTTWTVTATDTAITSYGTIGIGSLIGPGWTGPIPLNCNYGGVSATGSTLGTFTSTTGSYQRLQVTFTAIQPTHTVQIATVGNVVADTVNLDALQHEPGSSASAFSATGPVIYGVHRGYVERWPSKWNHKGMYGYAEITTVDGFAALAAKKLHTEIRNSIIAKKPNLYWPLNESNGASTFGEASGNGGPPLVRVDDPGSPGPDALPVTFQAGTQTNIPGDPGGTGLTCTGDDRAGGTFGIVAKVCARAGTLNGVGYRALSFPPPGTTGYTIAFWLARNPNDTNGGTGLEGWSADGTGYFRFYLDNSASPMAITWTAGAPGSDGTGFWLHATDTWADGKPHLYVLTVSNSGGNSTGTFFIDNNQIATDTQALSGNPWSVAFVNVGGDINYSGTGGDFPLKNAVYAHVGLWSRALSASERSDLWNAGKWGYLNESSGARVARYLTGNYSAATAIDTGQSTMGVSNLAEGTTLLDACQSVALSENGNLWVDSGGTLQFAARTRRYLATTAQATFGENAAAGENPYEDDIAYDFDATLVYNDIEVQQSGGTKATAPDPTSQANYGPRSYQREVNIASSLEAIDAANWILATHKDPHQRVATLTIKPSHNPALWPVALGAEIGQRVTVKRRTTAGLTMSSDYFVEQISHSQKPDEWTVSFQMSPAIGYQVGIFDDATYGRFDSTLIFGY